MSFKTKERVEKSSEEDPQILVEQIELNLFKGTREFYSPHL